jgi:hypothetical protein
MSFFRNFRKVRIRTNSEIFVSWEVLETAVFNPKTGVSKLFPNFLTQKQGFLTQKQEIISKLFSELYSQNFCEFEKNGYFRKISELRKTNFSETRENEKFGNFRLTQGLTLKCFLSR